MHDMARKLQRNKENGASLAIGASKDSLYTIQDGGAPSHRIAASSGQVGGGREAGRRCSGAAGRLAAVVWGWGWVGTFASHRLLCQRCGCLCPAQIEALTLPLCLPVPPLLLLPPPQAS